MPSKVNYALVGLFVILLGAALLGVVFWLTVGSEVKIYDRYRVYFQESVAGLNPRAAVRYRGVQVGQVDSIGLDPRNPDRVDVVLNIERGTPIRRDTIATLSTQGLTGVAAVELSGGGLHSLPLEREPEQDLPVIQAGPSLVARLDDAFNNVLTNFNTLSQRLERLLGDENQAAITEILRQVSTITGAVADRSDSLGQTLANLETFSDMLAERAERTGQALDQLAITLQGTGDLGQQARATLREIQASAQAARKTADHLSQTSQNLSVLAEIGQRELRRLEQNTEPELNALLAQANSLITVLRRLAELLEQHPNALLQGRPIGRPGPGEQR